MRKTFLCRVPDVCCGVCIKVDVFITTRKKFVIGLVLMHEITEKKTQNDVLLITFSVRRR